MLDRTLIKQKLDALWSDDRIETLDLKKKKYVVISDLHLGDGLKADDFRGNEETLCHALAHYNRNDYTLILLGDIEEFWVYDLQQIIARYEDTVYRGIKAFGDKRVHRLFGNHDAEWGLILDPARSKQPRLQFAAEALKMRDVNGRVSLLLVHGHQGSRNSDKSSWISRFFLRLFKTVKPVVRKTPVYSPKSATKSTVRKNYERILYSWAKNNQAILICGHSHRANFASKSFSDRLQEEIKLVETELETTQTEKFVQAQLAKLQKLRKQLADERRKRRDSDPTEPKGEPMPCYFNSGCALYTDGLTTIELEHDTIRLVKWDNDLSNDKHVETYGEGRITDFIAKMENVYPH